MKLIFLLALSISLNAFARSIALPPEKFTPGNFEKAFTQKCVQGSIPAPAECQAYAGVLKSDLMSILALIEDSSHPDTVALFKELSTVKDERLKAYALSYLSKNISSQDEGLLQSALNALLSTDYWLGRIAAKILANSKQAEHQELGKTYLALQGEREFETKEGYSQILSNEFFQSITTFFENAHFPAETRFIGMDSPLIKPQYNNTVLGGKGYILPGSLANNAKEIARITGLKPAQGLTEIQARMQVLTQELMAIAQRMQRGDFSQMARMTELQNEMTDLSKYQGFWLTELTAYAQMKNLTVFFKNNGTTLEGAIVLKEWSFYNGTSVLYLGKW